MFFSAEATSRIRRITAMFWHFRNGWKSLKTYRAGSTCSITFPRATRGSWVAVSRFFCDWRFVPAGTRPVLTDHSNTFLLSLAAI